MCKEQDSREKLESDCRKLIVKIQKRTFSGRDAMALRCQLYELLDRQAAITERDMQAKINDVCAWSTELQAKVNELTAERDKLSTLELNQRVKVNEWRDKYYDAKKRLDDIRETVRNATLVDLDGEVVE